MSPLRRFFGNGNGDTGVDPELLSPKVRRLYEETGHLGPWSNSEYLSVVGVVEPSSPPEPDPPEKVVEAAEEVEEAREEYDDATEALLDAKAQVSKLEREVSDSYRVTPSGPVLDEGKRQKLERARERTRPGSDLARAREDADRRLRRAKAEHGKLYRQWRRRLAEERTELAPNERPTGRDATIQPTGR